MPFTMSDGTATSETSPGSSRNPSSAPDTSSNAMQNVFDLSSNPPTSSENSRGISSTQPATETMADDEISDTRSSGVAGKIVSETTALMNRPSEFVLGTPHAESCNHGTFSPKIVSRTDSNRSGQSGFVFGGEGIDSAQGSRSFMENVYETMKQGSTGRGKKLKKRSTTSYLAERHGIKNTTSMYLPYYIPFLGWIHQYRWHHFRGDLIAALTMASFYVPMALSYASNLAHVPPINGLYSFIFHPLIYAVFGSCPQMVVGPEAPGSLLVGSVVKSSIDEGKTPKYEEEMHARVAGVVTGMAGALIFVAGIARLGFLDGVLSRPFLRGFISAIGFVIFVDQLIPELGLVELAEELGDVSHKSSVAKLRFLFNNFDKASEITCVVAGISFVIIMVAREMKKYLQPRFPNVAYIPDRFIVVVLSTVLCRQLGWEQKGLAILGEVNSGSGTPFPFHWPFQLSHMKHVREAMGTSFLIALLGFFESSVAAKSLGTGEKNGINGIALSPNRELVALGLANIVGGCFAAIPAFGGYGRSKANASLGGKTPMSSVFLSLLTIACVLYLLPAFYYLPKAILSSMITVVAWSLIEEAPHDIMFFVKIRGWTELGMMFIIFAATMFYSLTMGMAIGVGLSLLSVIKHSTRPRIQILGRIPGTNRFENAEDNLDKLEFIEGCLIVKIPEPLTFANTGELKNRLRRLELYGTTQVHPALPRVRSPEHNKNIIFDIHGVTGLDGSGTQVLEEIVRGYRERGVHVFFSRGPSQDSQMFELFRRSGIVDICGGLDYFVSDVGEALRLTEMQRVH